MMKNDWVHSRATDLQQRYWRLLTHIQQLPHPGARPLAVAGRVAGWITARATDTIGALPGVRVTRAAVHIGQADTPTAVLNHDLAHLACALREADCLRGWRGELLDVVAEGQAVAVMERAALRPLGLLTRAVHLNASTPDGCVWAAQRAPTKTTDPGLWDTLVGGLCAAGESLYTCLLRESYEEAGLSARDLAACTTPATILRIHRRLPEGMQVEDVIVSECVLPGSAAPANIDGEVSCIRALDPDTLWNMMQNDEFTLEAELVILHGLLNNNVTMQISSHIHKDMP